jgi:hypothetical protein
MSREFASWADPSGPYRPRPETLHNPFKGFGRDLRLIGRGWRWGRGARHPGDVERLPAQQRRTVLPLPVRASLRDPLVGWLKRVRVEVTGLASRSGDPRVALAHVESGTDLAVLLESVPASWKVVTRRIPKALPHGRTVLVVTDFASAGAADVVAKAAQLATRYGRHVVPVVVRRLAVSREVPTKLPTPRTVDEVLVRYGDDIVDDNPVTVAQRAFEQVGDLLAEDDTTWWQVVSGQVASPLVRSMPMWRRLWERTDPDRDVARTKPRIWR